MQAINKETKRLAALKEVEIKNEEDLEDFSVEINILAECPHKNIVGLHEAFFFDDKLSVCGNSFIVLDKLKNRFLDKSLRMLYLGF